METPDKNEAPRSAVDAATTCYAVIACRWGWTNNGFAVLLLTTDRAAAEREADDYADYRGGKYGVGVFDVAGKQVYHAPSSYGETEIHTNHRMDTFERVGGGICCAFEQGKQPDIEKAHERWREGRSMERVFAKHNAKSAGTDASEKDL